MELEIVNKLYLELDQFTTAKTEAAINLEYAQKVNNRRFRLLSDILECGHKRQRALASKVAGFKYDLEQTEKRVRACFSVVTFWLSWVERSWFIARLGAICNTF